LPPIYFIDRYKDRVHYDEDFPTYKATGAKGKTLLLIDHLTNQCPSRVTWKNGASFTKPVFNFRESS